jgi:hypothetical protein
MRMCLTPTLQCSMPHFSRCYKLSLLQAHWGRWRHTRLLWQACLFTACLFFSLFFFFYPWVRVSLSRGLC